MRNGILALIFSLALGSCQSEPSLERFMVENADAKNFVHVDVSPSMLTGQLQNLTSEEQQVLQSFRKLNVLAYKVSDSTDTQVKAKWEEVQQLVKSQPKYEEVMRFGSGGKGATLYVVGDEQHVEEFVLLGNGGADTGFAVVRFLGDEMKLENAMTLVSIIGRAQGGEGLSELSQFF